MLANSQYNFLPVEENIQGSPNKGTPLGNQANSDAIGLKQAIKRTEGRVCLAVTSAARDATKAASASLGIRLPRCEVLVDTQILRLFNWIPTSDAKFHGFSVKPHHRMEISARFLTLLGISWPQFLPPPSPNPVPTLSLSGGLPRPWPGGPDGKTRPESSRPLAPLRRSDSARR